MEDISKENTEKDFLVDIQHERLSFFTPAGEVCALNDVTIQMKEGEVLGIVGESGSGKSVTAYSIMGLTAENGKITGGTIKFNGHKIETLSEKELNKIRGKEVSIIFQDPMTSLNPVYTIGNQIEEAILLHTEKKGIEVRERAKELLALVGINEVEKRLRQYPHELSGGMRQRVMIAIALACEPKLLIADEPTTALDVTIQAQIISLLIDIQKRRGLSIIFISHDIDLVAQISERILVMYDGKIIEELSLKNYASENIISKNETRENHINEKIRTLLHNANHQYTKALLACTPKFGMHYTKEKMASVTKNF